nr:hypothetical protein [uncultured Psychroserpens sp.]
MKTLKLLFSLLLLSIIISSCTPQALDDNPKNITEDTQATGDDDAVDDGSKD